MPKIELSKNEVKEILCDKFGIKPELCEFKFDIDLNKKENFVKLVY